MLAGLVVLAALVGVGGYFYAHNVYTQAGPATADGKPRIVMIQPGDTGPEIAKRLHDAGAINSEFQFKLAVKAADTIWKPAPVAGAPAKKPSDRLVLKTGEFAVPSAASMEKVIAVLSTAKPIQYTVVVPEGLTSAVIVDMLQKTQWIEWHPVGQAADPNPRTLQLAGAAPAETPAEGTLLPGDYQVLRGEAVEGLLKRMSKAQDDLMKMVWDNRKPDLPFMSQREAINLASIVEKETGVPAGASAGRGGIHHPAERAIFAFRRIQPTVTYVQGPWRQCRALAMTARPRTARTLSPYNTYQNDGLPPTAISNPGKDAIVAVLNPPDSKAIYFVADGVTGGHKFAETLAEHEKNVASLARLRAGERAAANAAEEGRGSFREVRPSRRRLPPSRPLRLLHTRRRRRPQRSPPRRLRYAR